MGCLSEETLLFFQELLGRMTVTCVASDAIEYTRIVQRAASEVERELQMKKSLCSLRPGQQVEISTHGSSVGKNGSGGREVAGI